LASGDTVLINGANGGVGTAAVQIAGALGATVVATVRSEELRPHLVELGAVATGAQEGAEFVRGRGGADVVLELVGALHMPGNLEALARGGRLVIVGARPGDEALFPLRELMTRRAHVVGTTLRTRVPEEKARLVQEFGKRIVPLIENGTVTPVIDRVFPLAAAVDALNYVREPGKFGKVLLEFPASEGT
jgi:NADPH:quinone reductase-like Zn-dependent oxidoreductase